MNKRKDGVTELKRMLSADECCSYLGLGRNKAREFAEAAGARRTYGRRVLYDRVKLDAALDAMTE